MYITKELLKAAAACEEGIARFEALFPKGADLKTVITTPGVPYDMLWWGYDTLQTTEEEKKIFFEVVHIINSNQVMYSHGVENSNYVSHSKKIKNSSYVFNSKEVEDSKCVHDSELITNSLGVFSSMLINNSTDVIESIGVSDSTAVIYSKNVSNSKNINKGATITNCDLINYSNDLINCVLCAQSANLKNCLFCFGISEGENLIFNKPADPMYITNTKKQFSLFKSYLPKLILPYNYENFVTIKPQVNLLPEEQFTELPASFYQWAATLPNYDKEVLWQLTGKFD